VKAFPASEQIRHLPPSDLREPSGNEKLQCRRVFLQNGRVKSWERISENLRMDGWTVRHTEAMHDAEVGWTAIATRGGVRHSTHANDITLAFQELQEVCQKAVIAKRGN